MIDFIEQKKKEELRKIIFSDEFGWVDNHEWMMDGDKSVELLWNFFESALKQSYTKGVEDAIKGIPRNWLDPLLTGDNAIIEGYSYTPTDIENLLIAIKQRLQQLKEQQ